MKYILLGLVVCLLVGVSTIHYVGFLVTVWLHLYVFEPTEIKLASWIERINP